MLGTAQYLIAIYGLVSLISIYDNFKSSLSVEKYLHVLLCIPFVYKRPFWKFQCSDLITIETGRHINIPREHLCNYCLNNKNIFVID